MPNWKKVIVSGSDASLNSLYVINAVTASIFSGSFTGSLFGTASFAVTSSYITASNVFGPFGSNSVISSSYAVSASQAISSSYALSSSYAFNATSASYTLSASYAATASSAQNASDILVYVKNMSGAQIDKGKVVRIVGAVGDNPLIATASYENDNNSANTLGITNENIANNDFGYVMTEGTLFGVDTSTFSAGQLIFLGATGSITGSSPIAPLHNVRLGEVLRVQLNNGSIYVRVNNGYELGELHDVVDSTTTSSYGDLLVKSGSVWINSKQLTGSYGLTGSLTATSFTGSLQGTSSWANNATTASYALQALSASFASTASFVNPLSQNVIITGSSSNSLLVKGSGTTNGTNALRIENSAGSSGLIVNDVGKVAIGTNITPNASNAYDLTTSYIIAAYMNNNRYDIAGVLFGSYPGAGIFNIGESGWTGRVNYSTFNILGNVGINKTSPNANLDVSGSVIITGSLTVITGSNIEFQVTNTGVKLGNVSTDTHTATGSFNVSGSFNVIGPASSSYLRVSGSGNVSTTGPILTVLGSGSAQPIFTVQGSQGELFSVTDSLSGSLFSVNDISGLPILEVFSDNTTLIGDYQSPALITTKKVAQTNSGSFVVYSIPTSSYDGAFIEYTIKSGSNARAGTIMSTWANSTIQFTEVDTMDIGSTTAVGLTMILSGSNAVLTGSSSTGTWTIRTIIRTI